MFNQIGKIITTNDSPSLEKIHAILRKDLTAKIEKAQFVTIPSQENEILLLGMITNITNLNPYYESKESVYLENENQMENVFPLSEWDKTIIEIKPLGNLGPHGKVSRYKYPPSPGDRVYIADDEILKTALGTDEEGLFIGRISTNNFKVKVNLSRLLRKHLAILAISGAGKSYSASIILEELMMRRKELGRVTTLLIDPHGEYAKIFEDSQFCENDKVEIISSPFISIGVPTLHAWDFADFQKDFSPVQIRTLDELLKILKKEKANDFSLDDLISLVESTEKINNRTKEALIGWIYTLQNLRIFGKETYPKIDSKLKPGKVVILDLSSIRNIRSRRIICSHFLKNLYYQRINNEIPPILFLIEEAHQFCPEKQNTPSKRIIETISREGRKFFASLCLVSQRPAHLSTTALSQCNSQLILRIRNPYDLEFIGKSSEGVDRPALKSLPGLDVGEALLVGEAVRYPIFLRIRRRITKIKNKERDLSEEAIFYEESKY